MSKVAILFTGSYRTFDKTCVHILSNILQPNSATAFVLCESNIPSNTFEELFKTRWKGHIGYAKTVYSSRTRDFDNILEYLLKSKPAILSENLQKYGFTQDYLRRSGTILEYYQFMKCYELMLQYEKENNIKFDIIVRSRLDIIITQPINLVNFFDTLDINLINKYGEEIYIRSLGNENMCKLLTNNKVVKLFEYQPFIAKEPLFNSENTLKKINENKNIWTFYCNWIWIGKRHTMDLLYPFVYFYGNILSDKRDSFNSENQFYDYLQSHNCQILHFFTQKEWDLWTAHEIHKYKTILDDASINPEIDISQIIATIVRY
jgi:hypothetical protein